MYYAHQRPNMSTWWTCPLTRALQIYIVQVYEAEVDDVRCACRQAVLPVRSADPACSTLQLQKSSSIMDDQCSVFQIRDQGIAFINTYYYKVSIQFSTTKMRRAPHAPQKIGARTPQPRPPPPGPPQDRPRRAGRGPCAAYLGTWPPRSKVVCSSRRATVYGSQLAAGRRSSR